MGDKDWTGNSRSVVGCLGASCHSAGEREEDPIAAEWLINLENLNKNIWECACGQGHLAKVFEAHGYNVKATDLVDRGYGQGGVDFFLQNGIYNGDIVTNPPYKFAQEFVEHALKLIPDGHKVCAFLKVQFLEGKERKQFFENTPPCRVWVSSSRIQFGASGDFSKANSMMATAWYVWKKGYKGDTVLRWFN